MSITAIQDNKLSNRQDLLERYYTKQFNYNEYPNRGAWSSDYDGLALRQDMSCLNRNPERGSLLYVNVPFCKRQCYFCTCYTQITQDQERIHRYTDHVKNEMALYRRLWEAEGIDPGICEVHFGGGSPTLLEREAFSALIGQIHSLAPAQELKEVTLEVDPRGVDAERLGFYAEQGVNRLSFGVQDFDPQVQKAINRIQPPELMEALMAPEVRRPFYGINFDLLVGLPRQTEASLMRTIDTTCRLRPDRLMLMFLLFYPHLRPHHRLMDPTEMPDLPRKLDMFEAASERLLQAGYVRIGYDHFALPDDALARAQSDRTMQWNALGYRTQRGMGMIGVGAGSISDLQGQVYYQNTTDVDLYQKQIETQQFPVVCGHRLTEDEKIRRAVIHQWRCWPDLDLRAIESRFDIRFQDYFAAELSALEECAADGLVQIEDETLSITPAGQIFQAHILGVFDGFAQAG